MSGDADDDCEDGTQCDGDTGRTFGEDRHWSHKAPLADRLDIVFDDHADEINPHCKTPVVKMPGKKSADRGALRR